MSKILKHQLGHFLFLALLLAGVFMVWQQELISSGSLYSLSDSTWLLIALLCPIAHQIYVLVGWRLELYHRSLSKKFGDLGFIYFKVGFVILFAARLVSIIFLAFATRRSLMIDVPIMWVLVVLFSGLSLYLFYSVRRYFSFDRALGIDHFEPEKYRNVVFVREGIFKFTPNAMYVFGFLILYVPGLVLESKAALVVAAFNHLYIWVHYFFTELPDITIIYRGDKESLVQ